MTFVSAPFVIKKIMSEKQSQRILNSLTVHISFLCSSLCPSMKVCCPLWGMQKKIAWSCQLFQGQPQLRSCPTRTAHHWWLCEICVWGTVVIKTRSLQFDGNTIRQFLLQNSLPVLWGLHCILTSPSAQSCFCFFLLQCLSFTAFSYAKLHRIQRTWPAIADQLISHLLDST